MNSKGTFTSMIGLMVLVLMISSTYFVLTSIDQQESPTLLRQAGDLKRVMNKTRFRIDEAVAQEIANQTLNGCNAAQDFTVDSTITSVLDSVEDATGVECSHTPVGNVQNNVPFTVTLNCSLKAEKDVAEEDLKGMVGIHSIATTLNFDLQKSVSAQMNGVCTANVIDAHSGLLQATASG